MTDLCKKFTIVASGADEDEVDLSLKEAFSKIKQGYTSGRDSHVFGAYYFTVDDVMDEKEQS